LDKKTVFKVICLTVASIILIFISIHGSTKAEANPVSTDPITTGRVAELITSEVTEVKEAVTKDDLENLVTKEDMQVLRKEVQSLNMSADQAIKELNEKIQELMDIQAEQQQKVDADSEAYKFIKLDNDTRDLTAWVIALEATDQPLVGKRAVFEIICNRVEEEEWGKDIKAVLTSQGQFKAYEELMKYRRGERGSLWSKPTQEDYDVIDYVLEHGRTILPKGYVFFATYKANGTDFIQIQKHYFSRKAKD